MGLCGEYPCPPCPLCIRQLAREREAVTQQTFADLFKHRARAEHAWKSWRRLKPAERKKTPAPKISLTPIDTLFQLPDCGCVFLTRSLEEALLSQVQPAATQPPPARPHGRAAAAQPASAVAAGSAAEQQPPQGRAVRLLSCPRCRTRIFTASRFERLIKQQLSLYVSLKRKFSPPAAVDGMDVDHDALADVLDAAKDLAAGRWFACANGHLYRIEKDADDVAVAACPDCKAFIGASRGQLEAGNRYVELDAKEPAFQGHGMRKGMPLPRLPQTPAAMVTRVRIMPSTTDEAQKEHLDWVKAHFDALHPGIAVKELELIVNGGLLARYERRKAELLKQQRRGGQQLVEERLVYHGTSRANHVLIMEKGLMVGGRGVDQANGASYGEGVYVGTTPNVAQGYARDCKAFLFCRVLTGRVTNDCNSYRRGAGSAWDSYDGQSFCVVYREDQVLPCYIVHT